MNEAVRVVFVQDSPQEKVVAEQGNSIAILDSNSGAHQDHIRSFYLSTTMKISETLAMIPGCKRTPITPSLERFEFTLSKKGLMDFLLNNFPSLHFNE